MVDAVNNINNANNQMKLPKLQLGVVPAPQHTAKANLYSETDATRNIKKINRAIAEKKKNDTFEKRQSTPVGVFVVLGIAVAAIALYKLKAAAAVKNVANRLRRH